MIRHFLSKEDLIHHVALTCNSEHPLVFCLQMGFRCLQSLWQIYLLADSWNEIEKNYAIIHYCRHTHTHTHAVSRFYLSSVTGSFYSCLASLSLITQESSLFAIQLCKISQTPCCCTNSMCGQDYLLKSYLCYVFNLIIYRKGEFRDLILDVSRASLGKNSHCGFVMAELWMEWSFQRRVWLDTLIVTQTRRGQSFGSCYRDETESSVGDCILWENRWAFQVTLPKIRSAIKGGRIQVIFIHSSYMWHKLRFNQECI